MSHSLLGSSLFKSFQSVLKWPVWEWIKICWFQWLLSSELGQPSQRLKYVISVRCPPNRPTIAWRWSTNPSVQCPTDWQRGWASSDYVRSADSFSEQLWFCFSILCTKVWVPIAHYHIRICKHFRQSPHLTAHCTLALDLRLSAAGFCLKGRRFVHCRARYTRRWCWFCTLGFGSFYVKPSRRGVLYSSGSNLHLRREYVPGVVSGFLLRSGHPWCRSYLNLFSRTQKRLRGSLMWLA